MNAPTVAVFDTNVLVSGFLAASGPPGRIVEWLRTGALRAGVDDRIQSEYDDVLHRPELGLPSYEVDIVLRTILKNAVWARVNPEQVVRGDLPDLDDGPFLECATALGCELVSGNTRHSPPEVVGDLAAITPRQFLDKLEGRVGL